MKRLGFGWLPDYLTRDDLKAGTPRILRSEIDNSHAVYPRASTVGRKTPREMQPGNFFVSSVSKNLGLFLDELDA
ncbi:MAG: hypothetical protein HC902_13130 [Calothrix sp. SM1_5_4]|nr:hypothetical protein [Calothrix sp. SM1_5_4]